MSPFSCAVNIESRLADCFVANAVRFPRTTCKKQRGFLPFRFWRVCGTRCRISGGGSGTENPARHAPRKVDIRFLASQYSCQTPHFLPDVAGCCQTYHLSLLANRKCAAVSCCLNSLPGQVYWKGGGVSITPEDVRWVCEGRREERDGEAGPPCAAKWFLTPFDLRFREDRVNRMRRGMVASETPAPLAPRNCS